MCASQTATCFVRLLGLVSCIQSIVLRTKGGSAGPDDNFNAFYTSVGKATYSI